ncbi:tRNA nucleotidyltransferase [Thalassotalea sp. 1_MG-2023]|uniref:tRNA nucleotidyltransferase n=1 Tax=Thalassotalea sp. 1_MG-2023 TaxID=3062680 RepID=UPI0026E2D8D5|nr:tRNA nucleotidyltransferase [Thalassotalea sp. 1_MG-2023]MDO6428087.1 tRNA nucleotidyltransferase [Thalassotalea sp. 1_MG-2023]
MKNSNKKLPIEHYLVGGAVRDHLLGREIKERDYVVVGATVQQMLSLGFTQVGKDFPVFLHPESKEEYALARTEKKQGQGYTGFVCNASPEVTLEQDLLRRDLTVNAMAMTNDGKIIDPYQGKNDLDNRILRHVSNAFVEDPLRVLRVARFAARYHYLGFKVAPETLALMTNISQSNELDALSGERIWQEFAKSLSENNPDVFINVLAQCKALEKIWPNFADAYAKSPYLQPLIQSINVTNKLSIRFALLALQLRYTKNKQKSLNSIDSQHESIASIEEIANTLRIPNTIKWLAIKVNRHQQHVEQMLTLTEKKVLSLLNDLDVWRKPDAFEDFLIACQVANLNKSCTLQTQFLRHVVNESKKISAQSYIKQGVQGKDIRLAMDKEKLAVIHQLQERYSKDTQ